MDANRIAITSPKTQRHKKPIAGAPLALKASLGVLQRVSPSLAGWLVERLWFTPPRPSQSAESRALWAAGQPLPLVVDGRKLAARVFGDGPPVVLMHGWGGYGAQLGALIQPIVAAGHRVVVFDAFGHGDSPGSRAGFRLATFFDFADGLRAVVDAVGPLHAIVAHSGGAMATMLALRAGVTVERLVLLAPMARPALYAVQFNRLLGLDSDVAARWQERARARLGVSFEDIDATSVGSLALPPTLVIHDRRDREVPFADGEAIARAWPTVTLHPTEDLGHRRILTDAAVIADAVAFLSHRDGAN